jgi:cytochrome b561
MTFHWVTVFLICGSFALGLSMINLPLSPHKLRLYSWHKWLGVTIFAIAAVRLLWRLTHRVPALPDSVPPWQRRVARVTHWVLYALMLCIPLSGWFRSAAGGVQVVYLGLVPLPNPVGVDKALAEQLRIVHLVLNSALGTLVLIHAAAAVKHHFVDRDDVLLTMLPVNKLETVPEK